MGDFLFMLFNSLCSELHSVPPTAERCVESPHPTMDCGEFEKMRRMFALCPCVVGMIALYAPTL